MKLITERTILVPVDMEMITALSGGGTKQFSGYKHNEEWPDNDLKEALPVFEEQTGQVYFLFHSLYPLCFQAKRVSF